MAPVAPVAPITDEQVAERMAARMEEYLGNPNHPDLIGHPDGNPVTIRPVIPDPTTWAARWAEGVQRNADRWLTGIQNPRANFRDAAIQKKGAWANKLQAAIAGDFYAKGMAKVNVDQAIDTAVKIGASGFATGAGLRQPKFEARMKDIAQPFAALTATVRQMPAATDADNDNRALAMIKGLRAIGKARRTG
jgi:hypothetical protein